MDLNDLQEQFGGISGYQVAVISIVTLLPFGTSFMSQSSVFFSAVPDYRCAVLPIDDPNVYPYLTENNISELLIPPGDPCRRYAYNLSTCTGEDLSCIHDDPTSDIIDCDQGYYYDDTYFEESTVSEWDLLCGQTTLDSVANSLYFFGVFLGSAAVGPMMDWFSRKVSMLIMCILLIASGIACTFSVSYEMYIAMRVLVAFSSIPCFLAYYTYVSEISDRKWRSFVALVAQLISALSHTLLPMLAYFLRDWRELSLALSLIPSTYLVIYFFIPMSPRWLLSQGRENGARKIIERFARSKQTVLDESDWKTVVRTENEKVAALSMEKKYFVSDLFRPPLMRVVSLVTMFLWFTVNLVFYGLTLNVGTLVGNPYLNSMFNAFAEIIGYSLCTLLAGLFGRRNTSIFSFSVSGICCLTTMLLTQFADGNQAMIESSRWVAIIGKITATTAFGLVYQYTTELYPTVVRGTGISIGSMSGRIGSVIMPFTLQLQHAIPWLTQCIFGSFSIIAALLSLLLPETRNVDLMSTIDDAENFYRKNMRSMAKLMRATEKSKLHA